MSLSPSDRVVPVPGASPDGRGPHAEPGDVEEVYYEGSPPARGNSGRLLLCTAIGLVLIAVGILLFVKDTGPVLARVILVLLGIGVPFLPILLTKSVRYRISNYRIDFERGLLSKNIDTMELWHVEDLHFHQSILDRLMNVGTITVLARDESMPKLEIKGIPAPRPLYETLKQRVIAVKRQRGALKMDPG